MRLRLPLDCLASVIFAVPCAACGRGGYGGRLCDSCYGALPRLDGPACAVCREPFAAGTAGVSERPVTCAACRDGRAFERVEALGPFAGQLRELLLAVKFGARRALAYDLGRRTAAELGARLQPVDRVIPVPLGRRRRRERGYNQAEIIAGGVAQVVGAPLARSSLRRERETTPQSELSRRQRRANVRGAFQARGKLDACNILLVDDVITTGATVDEAARALRSAGAAVVRVLTIGRALREPLVAADNHEVSVGPTAGVIDGGVSRA